MSLKLIRPGRLSELHPFTISSSPLEPDRAQTTPHVYLCGPPAMMNKVITALHELNIDERRIHHERFSL
ncbi:MAG: hypothetical protein GXY41_09780 [Phycisphaerae bacterium]|nr:hypothetical protein [Phycisphaerae bacterium]